VIAETCFGFCSIRSGSRVLANALGKCSNARVGHEMKPNFQRHVLEMSKGRVSKKELAALKIVAAKTKKGSRDRLIEVNFVLSWLAKELLAYPSTTGFILARHPVTTVRSIMRRRNLSEKEHRLHTRRWNWKPKRGWRGEKRHLQRVCIYWNSIYSQLLKLSKERGIKWFQHEGLSKNFDVFSSLWDHLQLEGDVKKGFSVYAKKVYHPTESVPLENWSSDEVWRLCGPLAEQYSYGPMNLLE
jgi:hypothetical protein